MIVMRRFTEKNIAKRGFTIVEMVVVIAVIAILAAILIPTFASIMNDAEQRELRMALDTTYTAFTADCEFRDEPVKNMDKYIFVAEKDLEFTSTGIKLSANGYSWNGNESAKVNTVAKGSIDVSASTAVYGPFSGYYLLGKGMALNWTGAGSAADPYRINSYAELRTIAERVARGDTLSGKVFRLEGDIAITNDSWLPIGGYLTPIKPDTTGKLVFSGTLDGNGYSIGLGYGWVKQDGYCLFGSTSGATIKNLLVTGNIHVNANAGGIVATAKNTTVQNCFSEVNVTGTHRVGGIVGNATGSTKLLGCVSTGKINSTYATGKDAAVGGIVGEAASTVTIRDCNNRGKVTAMAGAVGGIAGIAKCPITACVNDGDVEAKGYAAQKISGGQDSLVGGIVGFGGGSAKVNLCGNTGDITAAYRSAGGIAGGNAIITNCANIGNITAKGFLGGIMGTVNNVSCTVTNAANYGVINARGETSGSSFNNPAGGIVGKVNSTSDYTLTLVMNANEVQFRKGSSGISYTEVGMIVGSAGGKVTLTNTFLGMTDGKGVYVGNAAVSATAVGKSGSVTGTPTVQASQSAFATAINALVGTNQTWTTQSGFFSNKYVPLMTHSVTYQLIRGINVRFHTAFVGASYVYIPFPGQTKGTINSIDQQCTFDYWYSGSTKWQPGAVVELTKDHTIDSAWGNQTPIKPVPFK